jgi:hypothetical protein
VNGYQKDSCLQIINLNFRNYDYHNKGTYKKQKWERTDRWRNEFTRQKNGRDKCDMGLLIV